MFLVYRSLFVTILIGLRKEGFLKKKKEKYIPSVPE